MNSNAIQYFNEQVNKIRKQLNLAPYSKINHISPSDINNRHKNKRCFIIGTAPTIDEIDLSKLKNEITFGLNSIVSFFIPDYFVAISNGAFIPPENLIHASKSKIMFLNFPLLNIIRNIQNNINFKFDENKMFLYFADNPNANIHCDIMTEVGDDPVTVCNGGTCLFPAIQFAYAMGCNPIYLLGIMLKENSKGQRYFSASLKKKPLCGFVHKQSIALMNEIVKKASMENRSIISATPECLFVDKNIISYVNYNDLF